ncbi:MAG: MraY family glycosyltransferase [Sediminispirochaetaceae bacterium]
MEDHLFVIISAGIFPFIVNLLLIPVLLKMAHHFKWYDTIDERKVHSGNIPRLGGVGIFLTSVVIIVVFLLILEYEKFFELVFRKQYFSIVLGCIIIHFVGLLDDFKDLKPHYKLYGEIAAACIFIFAGNYFRQLYIPFTESAVNLGWTGPVITFIWIIGVTNAINLIDGIDGLSGSLSAIAALFFGLAAFSIENYNAAFISMAIFGALVSFLLFNLPPAKIFMGDSGSLFIGFVLSTLPILTFKDVNVSYALPYGVTLLIIPILDTFAAIIRRTRKKLPFHAPDKQHIHHKLLTFGLSNHAILILLTAISAFLSYFAFFWVRFKNNAAASILIVLWILSIAFFVVLHALNKKHQRDQKKQSE